MNRSDIKKRLLSTIEEYKRQKKAASLADFKETLKKVKKNRISAYQRMKQQEKAGDMIGADRSRQAYEYCKKYESRLNSIIDGYTANTEKVCFTKDASRRYVKRRPEIR